MVDKGDRGQSLKDMASLKQAAVTAVRANK